MGSGDTRPQQSRPPTSEDTGEARAEGRAAPSTQEPGKPLASRVTDRQPQPGSGSSRLPGSVLLSRQTLKLPGQTEPRWDPSETRTQLPLQTWDATPGLHPQYPTPSTPLQHLTSGVHPQYPTPVPDPQYSTQVPNPQYSTPVLHFQDPTPRPSPSTPPPVPDPSIPPPVPNPRTHPQYLASVLHPQYLTPVLHLQYSTQVSDPQYFTPGPDPRTRSQYSSPST